MNEEARNEFLKKVKRNLKMVDAFKQNVNLIWYKTNKETGETDFIDQQGSWFGGLNTFIYLIAVILLLVFKHILVFKGQDDKYNNYRLQNDFLDPATAVMNFSNSNIMHVMSFYLDDIFDDQIRAEMQQDKDSDTTTNLEKYVSI